MLATHTPPLSPFRPDPAARLAVCTPSPQAGGTALQLHGLELQRGRQTVLQGLDLQIPAGSITAIVGPSGAGKSTLLASLNGLLRPRAGRVTVGGLGCLSDPVRLQEHRRRSATIFQEHALIDRLSSLDNVLLGLADTRHPLGLGGWPAEAEIRAAEALARVGLLEHAHRRVDRLSGGERQRIGIARALVRSPRLLLGDEPFASVDPVLAGRLAEDFRTLARASGITVILVLHQLPLARLLADRIIGLARGRICFDGPPPLFDLHAEARVFGTAC